MSIHDVSRSADLNRSKCSAVDEDTSSPGVLQMESESDSNRSPFHSDQEQKGSCESLSEGNYADEEDSQHMQDDKTRFKPISEDKKDTGQLLLESGPLPPTKSVSDQPSEKQSLNTQDQAKSPAIESENRKQSEEKYVGNLDVTELSDISDEENNFSNLSDEDKMSDKETRDKDKQSSNDVSFDSTINKGLENAPRDPNPDEAKFVSDETVPKSNEKRGISLISDKDRKPPLISESKTEEKLGFEDEISNNDRIQTSTDNVDAKEDNDAPAVYCNGFDSSKDGEDEKDTNLKETEETNAGSVLTEPTPTLITNILRFDFIGENGNESGSSKASDTDRQKTVGKNAKQKDSQDGAIVAENIDENDPNDDTSKAAKTSDKSVKNDTLEDKNKLDLEESGGSKDLGTSSMDSFAESSEGLKSPENSLGLFKCTVQVDPLPQNLIPEKDSFVILPRSELMKRTKRRKPAPQIIPEKKRKINARESKNEGDVPRVSRIRRKKRKVAKIPEAIPIARKRPPPRDRSGTEKSERKLTDKTKDLPKTETTISEKASSTPKPKESNSRKAKAKTAAEKVDRKVVKALLPPPPQNKKRKMAEEKKPEVKNVRDKRQKFSSKNKSNSKSQPKKQNPKAVPPKRVTRSSQRNK